MLSRVCPGNAVAFFGNRVDRTTIAGWRHGHANPPLWAVDQLRDAWELVDLQVRSELAQIKAGPGRLSGLQPGRGLRAMRQRQQP